MPAASIAETKSDSDCCGIGLAPLVSILRLFKARRGFAGLDILPQVVQENSPKRIALAIVSGGARPSAVGAHNKSSAVARRRYIKTNGCPDRVPRTLHTLPS